MSDATRPAHTPVLLNEIMTLLDPRNGETVVDATVGRGGHAREILHRVGPAGRLVAIDRDPESLRVAREALDAANVTWVHGNFADLESHLARAGIGQVDGVLADLGVSSPQFDVAERGFSFRQEGPLDMRMDPTIGETAAQLVARLSERDLARIFWEYGDERNSRRIAARIVEVRRKSPIRTTTELADLIRDLTPGGGRSRRDKSSRGPTIDPATRVFQALRIAVNDELGSLEALLDQLPRVVKSGGRAAIVSFHSLEDRRVKQAFRDRDEWNLKTKKPVTAGEDEIRSNPRARSAKLRVASRN